MDRAGAADVRGPVHFGSPRLSGEGHESTTPTYRPGGRGTPGRRRGRGLPRPAAGAGRPPPGGGRRGRGPVRLPGRPRSTWPRVSRSGPPTPPSDSGRRGRRAGPATTARPTRPWWSTGNWPASGPRRGTSRARPAPGPGGGPGPDRGPDRPHRSRPPGRRADPGGPRPGPRAGVPASQRHVLGGTALEREPGNVIARVARAMMYESVGNVAEAEADYRAASGPPPRPLPGPAPTRRVATCGSTARPTPESSTTGSTRAARSPRRGPGVRPVPAARGRPAGRHGGPRPTPGCPAGPPAVLAERGRAALESDEPVAAERFLRKARLPSRPTGR